MATKKRFGSPLKDNEMKTVMKGHVPLTTKKNTLWALDCFREWMLTRDERDGNEAHMQILTIDCCMEYNFCMKRLFYYNFCDRNYIYFPPN